MIRAPGRFNYITMVGMFSIVKAREQLDRYDDRGWYEHPEATVASKASPEELVRDGINE